MPPYHYYQLFPRRSKLCIACSDFFVPDSALHLLTPTLPRCPHMGCALKYNRQEHSWDCPCHGSRFTQDGRLIDNPATGDKKQM